LGDEGGYQISRSVRLRSSANAYLDRTFSTPTDNKKWTWSGWVKKAIIGTANRKVLFSARNGATEDYFAFDDGVDNLRFFLNSTSCAYESAYRRDPSAWYHVVIATDTTQATAANRVLIYVNGVQSGSALGTAPTQNSNTTINSGVRHLIGRNDYNTSWYFDGNLTEINFIDGQALTPSSFGETNVVTGVWQPKKYAGTYGTNGFYLNFSDNSTAAALGTDFSGNSNTWTVNAISVTAGVTYDSMVDSPTVGATNSNYAVLNPLDKSSGVTVADGNLKASNGAAYQSVRGSMAFSANSKIYFEGVVGSATSGGVLIGFGICTASTDLNTAMGGGVGNYSMTGAGTANLVTNGTAGSSISLFTAGELIQCAVDTVSGKVWLGRSNVWYNSTAGTNGDPASGANPTFTVDATNMFPVSQTYSNNLNFNFGQRPFSYTPPSGFVALNTQNLPAPTILKGNQYFDATLWTGTGATLSVTNSGSMQPDLVWIKQRSAVRSNRLHDSVRGVSKQLFSDTTGVETSNTDELTAFNSNGFTLSTSAGVNASAGTYVGWQWNAGGTTVTNTSGSISAQVRANATAGFSVVGYTGTGANATVGHGLGVAPSMIITKVRSTSGADWGFYHASIGNTKYLLLNTTAASATSVNFWNNTSPTSSVFSVGISGSTNNSGNTMVAYCFAAVAGYSAFGSYTGNGSADGPFVYLGFRPRFVIIRRTDAGNNWHSYTSTIDPSNVVAKTLYPNTSGTEGTENDLDFVSNGMKMRDTGTHTNASGGTYIYAAFAENPFKLSLAR
jgi:hypothetical protein